MEGSSELLWADSGTPPPPPAASHSYRGSIAMLDLVPAAVSPNHSWRGNDTIDVMLKGCFGEFNTIACVRNGLMSLLVLVTAVLCLVKICRLHIGRHPAFHQYIIFYSATLECLLCASHWTLGKYVQLDFVMQYVKLVQFLVVSHLYWTMASRAVRKESLTYRVLLPICITALLYFTVVVVLGCIYVQPSWIECLQPYWVMLSGAEFLLVQLFMLAGIYITKRLNEISTLDSVRRAQKRDLWILIFVFEISSICGLVYDITLKVLGDEDIGCSGIFLHMQEIYSPVFGIFMIVKFLLPMWAMLFVFQPIKTSGDQEELIPGVSEEGTYTSVFTPNNAHRYKPLYYPGGDLQSDDAPDLSATSPEATTPVFGPLRRSASALPAIRENDELQYESGENIQHPIL